MFSVVPRLSTLECPHLLLSAVLRSSCWAPAPAAVDWYLLPAQLSAANLLHAAAAVDQWHERMEGRYRFVDPAPHTMREVLIISQNYINFLDSCVVVSEMEAPGTYSSVKASSADSLSPAQLKQMEQLNALLTCPARNFFSRFSLAGEMFTDTSWWRTCHDCHRHCCDISVFFLNFRPR